MQLGSEKQTALIADKMRSRLIKAFPSAQCNVWTITYSYIRIKFAFLMIKISLLSARIKKMELRLKKEKGAN